MDHFRISPEWRFLLGAARLRLSEGELEGLRKQVTQGCFDWNAVSDIACGSGLAPLLLRNLPAVDPYVTCPEQLTTRIRKYSLTSAATGLLLFNQLQSILRALAEQRIPVIALKGSALATLVYGNPTLRPMADIDVLVAEKDLPGAEDTLLRLGYEFHGAPESRIRLLQRHYHFVFFKNGGTSVELHWNIDRPARAACIDVEGLWQRSRPAAFGRVEARVLSPEDLVLHLCVHAAIKNSLRLGPRPLCDLRETIAQFPSIDWEEMLDRAGRWGFAKHVGLVLRLAHELLGAAVPDAMKVRMRVEDRVLQWAIDRLTSDFSRSAPASNFARLLAGPSLKDKIEVMRATWSLARSSNYHPARLARLARAYGPIALGLFTRNQQTIAQVHWQKNQAALDRWLVA
jgi:hypothetical protein